MGQGGGHRHKWPGNLHGLITHGRRSLTEWQLKVILWDGEKKERGGGRRTQSSALLSHLSVVLDEFVLTTPADPQQTRTYTLPTGTTEEEEEEEEGE